MKDGARGGIDDIVGTGGEQTDAVVADDELGADAIRMDGWRGA